MSATWILLADGSRARVFEESGAPLQEIADFANPAGRAQNRDLVSDAQGRYASQGEIGRSHSDAADVGAVEHEVELFAKHLARYLEKGRTDHRYDRLWLIAAPKFLGALRANIGKEVRALLEGEIDKDLIAASVQNIAAHIADKRQADKK